jgi:TonB family protein
MFHGVMFHRALIASVLAAPGCATTTTTVESSTAADPSAPLEPSAAQIVILRLKIGADGVVRDAQVVQSAGPEADAAALKAVYRLHFNPAQKDGEPVESTIQFAFAY